MKRTTLLLEESNYLEIKRLAVEESCEMTALVNEFIREGVSRRRSAAPRELPPLPTFDMGRPRVDLADRDALEQAMED